MSDTQSDQCPSLRDFLLSLEIAYPSRSPFRFAQIRYPLCEVYHPVWTLLTHPLPDESYDKYLAPCRLFPRKPYYYRVFRFPFALVRQESLHRTLLQLLQNESPHLLARYNRICYFSHLMSLPALGSSPDTNQHMVLLFLKNDRCNLLLLLSQSDQLPLLPLLLPCEILLPCIHVATAIPLLYQKSVSPENCKVHFVLSESMQVSYSTLHFDPFHVAQLWQKIHPLPLL